MNTLPLAPADRATHFIAGVLVYLLVGAGLTVAGEAHLTQMVASSVVAALAIAKELLWNRWYGNPFDFADIAWTVAGAGACVLASAVTK